MTRHWRRAYIQRGQFLGQQELTTLLTAVFGATNNWPPCVAAFFFASEAPLVSLNCCYIYGTVARLRRDAFSNHISLVSDFGLNAHTSSITFELSPQTLSRYLDRSQRTPLPQLVCIGMCDHDSRSRPTVRLILPASAYANLSEPAFVLSALTTICTFSVQLYSKRDADKTRNIRRGVAEALTTTRNVDVSAPLSPLDQMYTRLLHSAISLTKSNAASLYLHARGTDALKLHAAVGLTRPPTSIDLSASAVESYVFTHTTLRFFLGNDMHRTAHAYDLSHTTIEAANGSALRHMVAFPLMRFDPVAPGHVGVLILYRSESPFTKGDIELLQGLLDHCGTELHGIGLTQAIQSVLDRSTEIVKAPWVSSPPHTVLGELSDDLLRTVLDHTPATSISVRHYNTRHRRLERVRLYLAYPDFQTSGGSALDQEFISVPDNLTRSSVAACLQHRRRVYVPDFAYPERAVPPLEAIVRVRSRSSTCSLSLPVFIWERVVGTINIESTDTNSLVSYIPYFTSVSSVMSFMLAVHELYRLRYSADDIWLYVAKQHRARQNVRSCLDLVCELESQTAMYPNLSPLVNLTRRRLDMIAKDVTMTAAEDELEQGEAITVRALVSTLLIDLHGKDVAIVRDQGGARLVVPPANVPQIRLSLDCFIKNALTALPLGIADEEVTICLQSAYPGMARIVILNASRTWMPNEDVEHYLFQPLQRDRRLAVGGFLARQNLLSAGGDVSVTQESYESGYARWETVVEFPVAVEQDGE